MTWTAEQDANLRRLWASGHAPGQIALMLKVTRQQVLRRAFALKLEFKPNG